MYFGRNNINTNNMMSMSNGIMIDFVIYPIVTVKVSEKYYTHQTITRRKQFSLFML